MRQDPLLFEDIWDDFICKTESWLDTKSAFTLDSLVSGPEEIKFCGL